MSDIVVSGGFVVDGTGAPGRNADIGVNGDRIAAIGNLRSGEASLTLDAAEMVVAPGFVEVDVAVAIGRLVCEGKLRFALDGVRLVS